jgi:colanic acid biosynthesis glycosyl transferase WcaI
MSNKQGLELIVEAAKSLDKPDSNIRFVLCGEGPHREALESLGAGLNNIQFLGLQPEENFGQLLQAADVHLIPQKGEAADLVLPSKLGGILASGRPAIVMAKLGTGLAEEVGEGGMIIPPGSADALATAVSSLAHDRVRCRSLGEGARAIAEAKWDKTAILSALQRTLLDSTGWGERPQLEARITGGATSVAPRLGPNS